MFRTGHKYRHFNRSSRNHRACDCIKANIIVPQLHNELLALVKCLRFSSNLVDMKSQYAKGNKPANSAYHQPKKCPHLAVFTLEGQLLWAFIDLSQGVRLSFEGLAPSSRCETHSVFVPIQFLHVDTKHVMGQVWVLTCKLYTQNPWAHWAVLCKIWRAAPQHGNLSFGLILLCYRV